MDDGNDRFYDIGHRSVTIQMRLTHRKYSAIGPKVRAGKNDNAATMMITVNTKIPKVAVSVCKVPSLQE